MAIGKEMEEKWEISRYDYERNEMFLRVDREFLDVLDGSPIKTCTINDGIRVLEIIEAARQSSLEGRVIKLKKND